MPWPTQESRLLDALRRVFGITGHVGAQLLDDLLPVLDALNLPLELRYPAQESLYWAGMNRLAVAAQVNNGFIVNPTGSGHVVIVERLIVAGAGGYALKMNMTVTGALGVGDVVPRDGRISTTQTVPQVWEDPNGVADAFAYGNPYGVWMDNVAVILPGGNLRIANGAVNQPLAFTAQLRDRALSAQGV